MHDFTRFVEHLHLLLGVKVVGEDIDLGYHVVGQLVIELLYRGGFAFHELFVLMHQLGHGGGTGPAGSLVSGHMHRLDVGELFERLQSDNHLYGGAVGVGNHAAGTHLGIGAIDFGHHQRHIFVHAECARIVDHDSAIFRDGLFKLFRGPGSRRSKRDVYALEIVVVFQLLHDNLFTPEVI